jgi:hypothetical protein
MQITTIGFDLAKNVFQAHGIDAAEKVVVRKQLRRSTRTGVFRSDLAMPDGHVLPNPPSFAEFTRYAESWRVKAEESLLCNEGKVPPGMPPKPTFADDLNPTERARV